MPLYEYSCEKCKTIFEVVQKFSDAPLEHCPQCQGAIKKEMSLGGFALKGTGWFSTDYKKSSEKNAEIKPVAKVETKSENKSENKS